MSDFSLTEINERISKSSNFIDNLKQGMSQVILGQEELINKILISMLANGHILLEGVPGLAKTLMVKTLAKLIETNFQRIQFTPDMLPADLMGTLIYNQRTGEFDTRKGPIFSNIILADEINRSPAKVQSALLEAMQEHTVTIGEHTFVLDDPFLVLATQNPIEQEGTYPLPEAQLDRFLMHVTIDYPAIEAERDILHLVRNEAQNKLVDPPKPIAQEELFAARQEILAMHMAPEVEEYIIQLIMASRKPEMYGEELASWLEYGASPRGTISLDRCSRAYSWIKGRDFVSPDDVQEVLFDVLRHRILLSFEAEASGVTPDKVLETIRERVPSA